MKAHIALIVAIVFLILAVCQWRVSRRDEKSATAEDRIGAAMAMIISLCSFAMFILSVATWLHLRK